MLEMIDKDRQGMVLRIERSSIHDGDGFRTVVFLKGCPLRCQWCSTPESQSFGVEKTADNVYGTLMTVEDVMKEIRKDSLFFFLSTGGVTLSGGEVLAQPEFALALLRNCKKECFNTAIETCFFGPWEHLEALLPYINTIYADLKLVDSERHKKYCGVDNTLIMNNLRAADAAEAGSGWSSARRSSRASTTRRKSSTASAGSAPGCTGWNISSCCPITSSAPRPMVTPHKEKI